MIYCNHPCLRRLRHKSTMLIYHVQALFYILSDLLDFVKKCTVFMIFGIVFQLRYLLIEYFFDSSSVIEHINSVTSSLSSSTLGSPLKLPEGIQCECFFLNTRCILIFYHYLCNHNIRKLYG